MVRIGSPKSAMKVESSSWFAAILCLYVIVLGLGWNPVAKAQTPTKDDDPAELNRWIVELYHQGKFKEAIPLAEKLVALSKQTKGDEDPDTATELNNLAVFYQAMGDYPK
jgi:hypothetical protein